MKTPNLDFNTAWDFLKQFHLELTTVFPGVIALDFKRKPKLTQKEWLLYFDALQDVIVIGHRNKWLKTHTDNHGNCVYFLVESSIANGTMKGVSHARSSG
jgi:hypothetical protein